MKLSKPRGVKKIVTARENSKPPGDRLNKSQDGSNIMISLNTNLVDSHIVRIRNEGQAEYLILQRSEKSKYYPETWQILTGHVQEDETAAEAVVRELREETKLNPLAVYSLNYVSRFYEVTDNSIYLVPVFVTVVPFSARVVLNRREHQRYKWCISQQAQRWLHWQQHRRSVMQVQREFIERKPTELLKVYGESIENNDKGILDRK